MYNNKSLSKVNINNCNMSRTLNYNIKGYSLIMWLYTLFGYLALILS